MKAVFRVFKAVSSHLGRDAPSVDLGFEGLGFCCRWGSTVPVSPFPRSAVVNASPVLKGRVSLLPNRVFLTGAWHREPSQIFVE